MLKEIIALWKGEGLMKKVVDEFNAMLADAEFVYTNAWNGFASGGKDESLKKLVYERDKSINKREREIRRKLSEHLSINPKQDVSGCLAMMSMVKDAERIGDYSKNIFDLSLLYQGDTKTLKHLDELSSIQKEITDSFPKLIKAYESSDEVFAKEILKSYGPIKDKCNKVLEAMFSEDMSSQEAVVTTLLSRYLKRINSHISNIASGLVYPIDKIDFVRGDLLE